MDRNKLFTKISKIYTYLGFLLLFISIIFIAIPTFPYIWYKINPNATQEEIAILTDTVVEDANLPDIEPVEEEIVVEEPKLPPLDLTLPEGYYIDIPTISVLSPISNNPNYDEALKKGSWIVPEYGNPENSSLPIIIAAHRFGYQYWSREERERISFFNLPKTNPGEDLYIYWNQRKYTYKIYKTSESTYITDYEADLILYTCKYLNSPVRIFRYANLEK
jgi:LPXTG-site transpeptidase (sortase) family protein